MAVDDNPAMGKKSLPRWLTSVMPRPLAEKTPKATASAHDEAQDYLIGLRGCLAIMSFLWTFLITFAPAAVYASLDDTGPSYQQALRKSLSVLFWNGSLIYSSIIFLSARTICLPFLLDSTKTTLASAVVRRGLRMWFPTAAALVVCYIVFTHSIGTQYLEEFVNLTGNTSVTEDLYVMPSSLVNFNSIFMTFWVSHNFSYQAASYAFPTQTLWVVSAVFQQSYTVFTTMVIIPFTRKKWRLYGAFFFIITAWWVYSWAWFSITGLLFADVVMNMDFKARCQQHRLWSVAVAATCMAFGYAMQFIWAAARPDLQTAEINYHTGLYSTGGVYTWNDTSAPQLRADNYLVIVGFFIFIESTDLLQKIFRNPVFVVLGKRSYSYFLTQSIIIYTLGIRTALRSMDGDISGYSKASGVAFIACLLVTGAAGEVFYWLFDKPSQVFARFVFAWLKE